MGDVVVVGAGIIGAACAYELAKAGASVTMLEYGKSGMQATNAAAGMLAPLTETDAPGPLLDAGVRALRDYPDYVDELESEVGFELEFRRTGILNVAFDEDGAERLRRRWAWQRELGHAVEWLDGDLCRELEPRLTGRAVGGVFSEREATVSNQLVALALVRAAVARRVTLVERAPVTRFQRSSGRVTAVVAGDREYACDTLVLAAGARSGQLAARFGADLPVKPIRGQMIALGGMVAPIRHVVWGPDGYLVPRVNGLVFAGATVEDVGFRRATTQAGVRSMRRMAATLVPQLSAATVHFSWAGLRPATPDGLPLVGPLGVPSNVVAATGHHRNGILLGTLTGRLVATGIVTGDWSAVPPTFDPRRFAAAEA
jgi:glycine oxidase